jgi:hypothetical protein
VLSQERETKKAEFDYKLQIELEKLQVERERIQAQIAIEQAKLGSHEAIVQLQEELAVQKAELDRIMHVHELERATEQAERDRELQSSAGNEPGGDMPLAA